MAYYRECPNCSNCEDGTIIYECVNEDCEERFCDDCKEEKESHEAVADGIISILTLGLTGGEIICPHCNWKSRDHTVKCTIGEEDEED